LNTTEAYLLKFEDMKNAGFFLESEYKPKSCYSFTVFAMLRIPDTKGVLLFFILIFIAITELSADITLHKDTLKVVSDDNYPPYIFRSNDGQLQGILVDQWKLWEKATGMKVNLLATDWDKALQLMHEGKADVIETIFKTPERLRLYDFSKPYVQIDVPVFYHRTLSSINDVNTLQGFTIGVKSGDACIEVLKDRGLTFFSEFDSYEELIDAAAAGQIKVFCIDRDPAMYFINRKHLEGEFRLAFILYSGNFHRAVTLGNKDVLRLVENGFSKIPKAEYDKINKKWLGSELIGIRYMKYVYYGLLIVLAIAIFFISTSFILRRRVKMRTVLLSETLKQLTASEEHYRNLIQHAHEAIYVVQDGIIQFGNMACSTLTGIPENELAGTSIYSLMLPEDVVKARDRHLKLQSGELPAGQREVRLNTRLNEMKWLLVNAVAIEWKGANATLNFASDITNRKSAEQELQKQNEEYQALNEEYQVINEQLQKSLNEIQFINNDLKIEKNKAEESDRLKTAFLANISHEIRTPLNGILGFSELIIRPDNTPHQQLQFFRHIEDNSLRLLATITDIVEASMLQTHQIKLRPIECSIQTMLNEVAELSKIDIEQKKLTLVHTWDQNAEKEIIYADVPRLKMILGHLLNNAVKFTSKGSVSIGYEHIGNELLFYVKDTGIGLAKELQDDIFKSFTQVETTDSTKTGGAGLGLTICKGLVDLMGGRIWLESQPGKGSVFSFTIPFIQKESTETGISDTHNSLTSSTAGITVLLAEDESSNYQYVQMALRESGIVLIHALNGALAVEMVNKNPDINLVLMDIKMPVMDGVKAMAAIRKTHPDLPVVALTAYAMTDDEARLRAAGFCDYYTKPVKKAVLLEAVLRNARVV
jgi:PAS domain S-box-containing protein